MKGRRGRGGDDAHSVSVLADFSAHRRSTPPPSSWHQSETSQNAGAQGSMGYRRLFWCKGTTNSRTSGVDLADAARGGYGVRGKPEFRDWLGFWVYWAI
ncbi:hypothetical protein CXB51_009795 [Gossypium anomalum]|uniref:Uncharacterized protein n=1 Tax=Gossypium anomalum TaxID=47600 RepID=A0A8J6CYW2_9ROSI|nr:hypothetical protein CXB51_009795 [Gossypium anomalum]